MTQPFGEKMGLHNEFPSYFYKRGNLFSTYLGTDPPEPQTRPRAAKNRELAER